MNELGFYTLAGQPRSPRDLVAEVEAGEAMGLGSAFISERWNIKEAATLSGAAGATSERLGEIREAMADANANGFVGDLAPGALDAAAPGMVPGFTGPVGAPGCSMRSRGWSFTSSSMRRTGAMRRCFSNTSRG